MMMPTDRPTAIVSELADRHRDAKVSELAYHDRDAIELDATTLPHHTDAKDAQRCPKCQSR